MKTAARTLPESFRVAVTLSQLLARMEGHQVPVGADQYRSVVRHLNQELVELPPGEHFEALLQAFPATAEVYENLQYGHAGLVRSPLDASLQAELGARDAIRAAAR